MRAAFTRELDSMTVNELAALKTMIDEKLQRANGPTKYASEAKIYKCIWRENQEIVYIGSTCEACHIRAKAHVYAVKTNPELGFHHFIADNGGPENFEFSLLRHVSCKTREELLTEEGDDIKKYKPRCNIQFTDKAKGQSASQMRSRKVCAVEDIPSITESVFTALSPHMHKLNKNQKMSLKKYALQSVFGRFLTTKDKLDDFLRVVFNEPEKERWLTTAMCLLDGDTAAQSLKLLRATQFRFIRSMQFNRMKAELGGLHTVAKCVGLQSVFDGDHLVEKDVLIKKHNVIMPLLLTVREALGIQSKRVPENGPGFRTLHDRLDCVLKYLLGFKCVNTLEGGMKQTRIEGKKTALGLYRFTPVDPFAEQLHTIIGTLQAENATLRTPVVTV